MPWQEQSLQLSFRNKDSFFRVFRGRRRFAARNTRTMRLEDLPALTDFMLRSSFFQCGTCTFKQIQGASMGSALAPVLCTLVASTTEFLVAAPFSFCVAQHWFTHCCTVCGQSCLSFSYRHPTQPVDPIAASFGVLRCSHAA